MVPKPGKSKRISCRQKYKVRRKVAQAHRKARREAKKNPQLRKKLDKDPGIPNLWPYKEKLLQRMEQTKLASESDKRDASKKKKNKLTSTGSSSFISPPQLDTSPSSLVLPNQASYVREVNQVLTMSQVIIEVLDARDPLGTRCYKLEHQIQRSPHLRLVLVLNKIDLIPQSNLVEWVTYLRNEFPTVPFKANTQQQGSNLSQLKGNPEDLENEKKLKTSDCLGADNLISLLRSIAKDPTMPKHLTVGVVGYPNVGKSSLINSLKRSKVCGVAPVPGHTTRISTVSLGPNLTLLDSPGIFQMQLPSISTTDTQEAEDESWKLKAQCLLRNAVKLEHMQDPMLPIQYICSLIDSSVLTHFYHLDPNVTWNDVDTFIGLVAQKKGQLMRGGRPNVMNTIALILADWNQGRLPYYSEPPKLHPSQLSSTMTVKSVETTEYSSTTKQISTTQIHPSASSSSSSTTKCATKHKVATKSMPFIPDSSITMDIDE